MLLEYGVRNFFGFKEGAVVSFRKPASKLLDDRLPNKDGCFYSLCVKGKNASGKTNLLKAINFVASFCSNSFSEYKPGEKVGVEPFYTSKDTSDFYVEFNISDVSYKYELSLTEDEVRSEVLSRKRGRWVKILERKGTELKYLISDFKFLKNIKLRSNASVISSAHQYELAENNEFDQIFSFFDNIIGNVNYAGLSNYVNPMKISEILYKNSDMLSFTKKIIMECDTGISDIVIKKAKDDESGEDKYLPFFIHKVGDEEYQLPFFTESSGTKSLFSQLASYQIVLYYGSILCLDEFDINLHPHILPKLVDLFDNDESNPKNAQLIFTSHNTEIMDKMGKYRTYIVEKQDNECFAYRLDEIPGDILRNDRLISPIYNSGKIGGVPIL